MGGFVREGSSDDYVLLGGGGHKLLSEIGGTVYYAEIEYLEGISGTQWINTGYIPNSNTELIIQFAIKKFNTNLSYASVPFGARMSWGNKQYALFFPVNNTSQTIACYGNTHNQVTHSVGLNDIYVCNVNKNTWTVTKNSQSLLSYTFDSSESNNLPNLPLYLFAMNINSQVETQQDTQILIYNCTIKENGQTILDFIPVRVGQVGYMYDKVSCRLFGNSGTGNFVLGPDVSIPYGAEVEYLETTGTYQQFIDTGIKGTNNTSVYIKGSFSDTTSNDVLGIAANFWDSTPYGFVYNKGQNNLYTNVQSGYIVKTINLPTNTLHEIELRCTGTNATSYINGSQMSSKTISSFTTIDTIRTYINVANTKIYAIKVWENNVLVRDMIPVRVGQFGYMYDKVSGKLFGNSGTVSFVIGPYKDYLPLTGGTLTGQVSAPGFVKSDSSDSYVLLGGGGHKLLSEIGGSGSGNYLALTGGTMTGTPYINMPASAASIANSQPFGITYGRIQCYGTMNIAGDTDGSTNEYVIITSGYGVSSSTTANGLAIGYNTLTWKNNTIIHSGNISSYVSGGSGNYVPAYSPTGYNVNTCYDSGLYLVQNGSNTPFGAQYAELLTLSYRQLTGNTIPDFGAQIIFPNGDDRALPNAMFYRTSQKNSWNAWQQVFTTSGGTITGNLTAVGHTTLVNNSSRYALEISKGTNQTDTLISFNGYNNNEEAQVAVNATSFYIFNYSSYRNNSSRVTYLALFKNGYFDIGKGGNVNGAASDSFFRINESGNVGINTTSPAYKLDVNGSVRIDTTMVIYNSGNDTYFEQSGRNGPGDIYFNGAVEYQFDAAVWAWGFDNQSDIRKKNIIDDVNINIYDIANAPLFKFTWKKENRYSGLHIGSSAQYWQTILPELVSTKNDADQTLSMQYDVIALASTVTVAKKIVELEHDINILKSENQALKKQIEELKTT